MRSISASTNPGGVSSASPWKLIDQVRVVKRGERLGTALGAVAAFGRGHDDADAEAVQASAIRSSSVTTKTPDTPRTRRAASTLRRISGFGLAPRAPLQL